MKKLATLISLLSLFAVSLSAIPIQFNLVGSSVDEVVSGSITEGGVTATLTAHVDGAVGELNQSGSYFGVNALVGGASDVYNQIDGDDGAESISIFFDTDVLFTQVVLTSTTSSDSGLLTFGGVSHSLDGPADIFPILPNLTVLSGESVLLSWVSGNGFGFDSFTIDTEIPAAAVPEAGTTLTFLGLAAFGLILFRRFQT